MHAFLLTLSVYAHSQPGLHALNTDSAHAGIVRHIPYCKNPLQIAVSRLFRARPGRHPRLASRGTPNRCTTPPPHHLLTCQPPWMPPNLIRHRRPPPTFLPATLFPPLSLPPPSLPLPPPPSPPAAPARAATHPSHSLSILTVAQISPDAQGCWRRAEAGQKEAKTVWVWPQGWVWA